MIFKKKRFFSGCAVLLLFTACASTPPKPEDDPRLTQSLGEPTVNSQELLPLPLEPLVPVPACNSSSRNSASGDLGFILCFFSAVSDANCSEKRQIALDHNREMQVRAQYNQKIFAYNERIMELRQNRVIDQSGFWGKCQQVKNMASAGQFSEAWQLRQQLNEMAAGFSQRTDLQSCIRECDYQMYYHKGRTEMQAGKFSSAAGWLQRAYQIQPSQLLQQAIATCRRKSSNNDSP